MFESSAVLVVEDDPLVTEVVSRLLSSSGIEVLAAADGNEAIAVFKANAERISCILLDFEIPGMHSARVLSVCQSLNADVAVLLASGYSLAQVSEDFPVSQVKGFISKPFDKAHLLGELTKILPVR